MHAVLIWDGAGFDTGEDVVVPSNVSLIQLPPYSPELNPVENLWHYLRGESLVEPPVPGSRRIAGGGGQESVSGPRRHRNDQDRRQSPYISRGHEIAGERMTRSMAARSASSAASSGQCWAKRLTRRSARAAFIRARRVLSGAALVGESRK